MQSTSRSFLLKWLSTVAAPIERIEDVGKGVVLCILMKKLDEEFPAFKRDPWNENDYQYNLKLVELYLTKKGVKMYFPIEKMVKLRMQDNLEVAQSIYRFVVRENSALGIPKDETVKTPQQRTSRADTKEALDDETVKISRADTKEALDELNRLKKCVGVIRDERDFYYCKLIEIERVIKSDEGEISEAKRDELLGILYKGQ